MNPVYCVVLFSACSSLLSQQLLSETQVLRNGIVHFLCLLTGYDRRSAPGEVTPSSFDVMATKSKVEDVLREGHFDLTLSADIQMVGILTCVNVCLSPPGIHVYIQTHTCMNTQR